MRLLGTELGVLTDCRDLGSDMAHRGHPQGSDASCLCIGLKESRAGPHGVSILYTVVLNQDLGPMRSRVLGSICRFCHWLGQW